VIEHLVEALARSPEDDLGWLALADALEEQGDPRGQALRLTTWLRRRPERACTEPQELRLQEILAIAPPFAIEAIGPGGMRFALVPPGIFRRRKPRSLEYRDIRVGAFWLGVFPVTQAQYRELMGHVPSRWGYNPDWPADGVSAALALDFCRVLSETPGEKGAGRVYRLPNDDEWEHACRGGTKSPFALDVTLAKQQANHQGACGSPCPVGEYRPNPFGLYDMHGQVWEWVWPPGSTHRLWLRGGSWRDHPDRCRSDSRSENETLDTVGFRVALSAVVPSAVRPILAGERDQR
jgi:uncharacterized protein (TIGR02996 family)